MANHGEEGRPVKKVVRPNSLKYATSIPHRPSMMQRQRRLRRHQTFANDRDFYAEIAKDPNAPTEEQIERQTLIRSIIEKGRYSGGSGKEQVVSYLHVKQVYRKYVRGRELTADEKGDITEILKDTYATCSTSLSPAMRNSSLRSFRAQQRQRDGSSNHQLLHQDSNGGTSEPDTQEDLVERSDPNVRGQPPVPPSNMKLYLSSAASTGFSRPQRTGIRRSQSFSPSANPGTIYADMQRKLLRARLQHMNKNLRKQQQRIENSSFAAKEQKTIDDYTSEVDKLRKWGLESSLHLFEKRHLMQRRVLNHALQLETMKRSVLKREIKKVEIELKSLAQMGQKTLVFRKSEDNVPLATLIAMADPVRKMQHQLNEFKEKLKEVEDEIALKRKEGLMRRLRPAERKAKIREIITEIVRSSDLTSNTRVPLTAQPSSTINDPAPQPAPLQKFDSEPGDAAMRRGDKRCRSEIRSESQPSPRLSQYLSSLDHLDDGWIDTNSKRSDSAPSSRSERISSSDLPIFEETARPDNVLTRSSLSPSPVPERRKSLPVEGHPLKLSPTETTGSAALPPPPGVAAASSAPRRSKRLSSSLSIAIPDDAMFKVWEHRAETDSAWTPYPPAHCDRLSRALANGETEVILTTGPHTYLVDLQSMEQRPHPMPFQCKTIPQVLVRWAPFMTEAQRKEAQVSPAGKHGAGASRPQVSPGMTISLPSSPDIRPANRHFPTEEEMLRYGLIQDRKWMLKTWRQCFIGDQVVNWMVAHGYARNAKEAEELGQALVEQRKIRYLLHSKVKFKDSYLFYRWCTNSPRLSGAGPPPEIPSTPPVPPESPSTERPPVPSVPLASPHSSPAPHPRRGKVPPIPVGPLPAVATGVDTPTATMDTDEPTTTTATDSVTADTMTDFPALSGGVATGTATEKMADSAAPATPTGGETAPALDVETKPTVAVATETAETVDKPAETVDKPAKDADPPTTPDTSSTTPPNRQEENTEPVFEELMDEPLTTLAWCGRMQRSESKLRLFKTLISDQRFKEGKQLAGLKEGILSMGSGATAGSVMTNIFSFGEDLRQRFGVRKDPVGSRVFHLLVEDIVYPDIREVIIRVVDQLDPEWRQKDKAMEVRNGWLSFLGAEPEEFGVQSQLADWAKQHQAVDKTFVQSLCEELKGLELDPEKEEIWAPNNTLRKFMEWVKSVYEFAERASPGDEIGADDFFPLVIWSLVHAGMNRPHMLMHFMTVFVLDNPHIDEQLQSEAMYYLTVFEASLHWIISLRNSQDCAEYSQLWHKGFSRALANGTLSITSVTRQPLPAAKPRPSLDESSIAKGDTDESGAGDGDSSAAATSDASAFELEMHALQSITMNRGKRFSLVQLVDYDTRPGAPPGPHAQLAILQIVAKTETQASQWVDWIMISAFDGRFNKKEALLPHRLSSKASSRPANAAEPLTAEKVKPSPEPERKVVASANRSGSNTGKGRRDDTHVAKELFLI